MIIICRWVAQLAASAQVLIAGMHAAAVIGAATLSLNSVAEEIVGEDVEQRRRADSLTGTLRPLGAYAPPGFDGGSSSSTPDGDDDARRRRLSTSPTLSLEVGEAKSEAAAAAVREEGLTLQQQQRSRFDDTFGGDELPPLSEGTPTFDNDDELL